MMTAGQDRQPVEDESESIAVTRPEKRATVARLRREIAAGTYVVDPDAVAAALIDAAVLTAKEPDGRG